MKTYLHGPTDFAKTMQLRFCEGDLDLPEAKKRYTSREEEEVDAQICSCHEAIENRTHMLRKSELYKEERDMSEDMKKIDGCDMKESGTLDRSEKTIAVLGDRW